MFSLVYSENALRQLKKFPHEIQQRIITTLERCRIRPYPHVKKLVGCPYFRLRAGDYRVIIDIQGDKLLIFVLELGHRRNIYK